MFDRPDQRAECMPSMDSVSGPRLLALLQSTNAVCRQRGARVGLQPSPSRRRDSEISDRRAALLVVSALLLFGRPAAAADKVDVIQLKNGDRLTCEIKKLDRSVLTISTDPLGKAYVHWGEITGMTSPRTFDVQVVSGEHYYGSLLPGPPDQLVVAQPFGSPVNLAMVDVIRSTLNERGIAVLRWDHPPSPPSQKSTLEALPLVERVQLLYPASSDNPDGPPERP